MRSIIIVILSIIFSALVFSQTDSLQPASSFDYELYLSGGGSLPYLPSEFGDYWDPGWNGNFGFGLSFSSGDIGYSAVYAMADYNQFGFNETAYRDAIGKSSPDTVIKGGSVNSYSFTINYKGSISTTKRSIAPYFVVGFGYMLLTSDMVTINNRKMFTVEGETISTFTWSFGVGMEIPVSDRLAGYIQGKSVIGIFDRPRQYFPMSAGIKLTL